MLRVVAASLLAGLLISCSSHPEEQPRQQEERMDLAKDHEKTAILALALFDATQTPLTVTLSGDGSGFDRFEKAPGVVWKFYRVEPGPLRVVIAAGAGDGGGETTIRAERNKLSVVRVLISGSERPSYNVETLEVPRSKTALAEGQKIAAIRGQAVSNEIGEIPTGVRDLLISIRLPWPIPQPENPGPSKPKPQPNKENLKK